MRTLTLFTVVALMGMVGCEKSKPIAPDVPLPQANSSGSLAGPITLPINRSAEPEDVPAIAVFTREEIEIRRKQGMFGDPSTCADRSRILLTAEDGTKWCHKPQTEGK